MHYSTLQNMLGYTVIMRYNISLRPLKNASTKKFPKASVKSFAVCTRMSHGLYKNSLFSDKNIGKTTRLKANMFRQYNLL